MVVEVLEHIIQHIFSVVTDQFRMLWSMAPRQTDQLTQEPIYHSCAYASGIHSWLVSGCATLRASPPQCPVCPLCRPYVMPGRMDILEELKRVSLHYDDALTKCRQE